MNKELNTVLHFLSWFRATLNKEYNTVNTPEEGGGWEMGGNKKNELFFLWYHISVTVYKSSAATERLEDDVMNMPFSLKS